MEKKLVLFDVSVFSLATKDGVSFNLCAPGAFSFVYPRALSNKEVSVFSLMIVSVVWKPTIYPATLVLKSLMFMTLGETLTKNPFWNTVPSPTPTMYE